MSSADRSAGRRDYDIDPRVTNYVEDRLRDTRHEFRSEVSALSAVITAGALKSSEEHAEVKVELRGLKDEIAALKDQSAVTDGLRASIRNQNMMLASLIVAAAGVLVAFLH